MKQFASVAIYLIPAIVVGALRLELIFTDDVDVRFEQMQLMAAPFATSLAWSIRNSRHIQMGLPYLIGAFVGSVLAIVCIAPIIASNGAKLEEMKIRFPGRYGFVTNSTTISPLNESHRRRGLKIGVPIGFIGGGVISVGWMLYRRRSLNKGPGLSWSRP